MRARIHGNLHNAARKIKLVDERGFTAHKWQPVDSIELLRISQAGRIREKFIFDPPKVER
jgi:hypothetical protein